MRSPFSLASAKGLVSPPCAVLVGHPFDVAAKGEQCVSASGDYVVEAEASEPSATSGALLKLPRGMCSILMLGLSAQSFAATGHSWKEEVLLHDGRTVIVQRNVDRGGRREVGQQPPIRQQSVSFTMPGEREEIIWTDHFGPELGTANFLPTLLDIKEGLAYLVVHPMGCLSYNKWGRPNPPYVVFKYESRQWGRVALAELPLEIKTPNLIFSSPDDEARNSGQSVVSAEAIRQLYAGYKQPEYRSILREELSKERINEMCEERVFYKGYWVLPNDPVARKLIDQKRP